jgi:ABC-2 type transport system permease protein
MNWRFLRSEFALRWRSVLWWSIAMVVLALFVDVFYPSVRDAPGLDELFAELPESVQPLLGAVDFTSPEGYLLGQSYLFFIPAVLLVFAIGRGASTIAGEEEDGTLDLLLAQPISRTSVFVQKSLVLVVAIVILSVATLIPTLLVGPALGLDVPPGHLVAVTAAMAVFVVFFAMLTMAVSAGSGRRLWGVTVAAGVGFVTYLVDGLGQNITWLEALRPATPWYWYNATDAVVAGQVWPGIAVLLAAALVVGAIGLGFFNRRTLAA